MTLWTSPRSPVKRSSCWAWPPPPQSGPCSCAGSGQHHVSTIGEQSEIINSKKCLLSGSEVI